MVKRFKIGNLKLGLSNGDFMNCSKSKGPVDI